MMMSDPTNTAVTALEGLLASKDEGVRLEAARVILDGEFADRRLRLQEADTREETNGKEIDRLAQFILENAPAYVNKSEGAVDTAIRLIKSMLEE